MTYYLIDHGDLYDVLAQGDYPSPQAALERLNPTEDQQVLSFTELTRARGAGALSWVDETLGGA